MRLTYLLSEHSSPCIYIPSCFMRKEITLFKNKSLYDIYADLFYARRKLSQSSENRIHLVKKKPDIRMNMQLKTLFETDVVIGIV